VRCHLRFGSKYDELNTRKSGPWCGGPTLPDLYAIRRFRSRIARDLRAPCRQGYTIDMLDLKESKPFQHPCALSAMPSIVPQIVELARIGN
jgi:hypothetical protein